MTPDIQFNRGAIDAGGCVTEAWELVKRRYWMYVGLALLTFILTSYLYCISWAIFGPVMGGVYFLIWRDMRDEPVDFGMMFKGFEKFVPLMVVGLLQMIPHIIGAFVGLALNFSSLMLKPPARARGGNMMFAGGQPDLTAFWAFFGVFMIVFAVLLVFMVVWYFIFVFAVPLTMEYDLPLGDAIKLSMRASLANLGGLIATGMILMLVGLLGAVLCGVGVIFISLPVMYVTSAVVYRRVFPFLGEIRNMEPPPPSSYNFGPV